MSKRLSSLTLTLAAGLMLMTGFARAEFGNADRDNTGSPVENTERNVRDKGDTTLTPEDQLENKSDRQITANIRKAIIDDKSMSTNARNAKIITRNGKVTLRGPVDNAAEKARLESIAQQAPGVTQVDNQLEIKAQ